LAVLAAVIFGAPWSLLETVRPSRQPALLELSNDGSYAEVLSRSAEILAQRPLDAEALLFRGIAHFYLALAEGDRVDPATRLDQAIIALRRARLDSELRYRDEAAYLLGKAYYHKGPYYYDSAVRYLTESLEHGYEGSDTHEYLGMALVRSGAPESGIEHFHAALQRRPSGLLYLSVGQLLERLGRLEEAERHFQEAVAGAGDEALEIRARFMLGALLLQGGRYADAGEQYQRILEVAPGSADAHLFLGDAYAGLGNVVRARAEWRRARNIDQQHHGANLRLRG
jgi:tetratricopeptide (TPR) repeat protein